MLQLLIKDKSKINQILFKFKSMKDHSILPNQHYSLMI